LTFGERKELLLLNGFHSKEFETFPEDVRLYIRQYFYLLGDCLKQNKGKIEDFKKNSDYSI
jgi:hypothetical protein